MTTEYQWDVGFRLLLSAVMINLCCSRHTSYYHPSSQRNKLSQQNKQACEGIPWVTLVPRELSSHKQANNGTLAAIYCERQPFTVRGIWVSSIPSWRLTLPWLSYFLGFSHLLPTTLLCFQPAWASWYTCSPSTASIFINSQTQSYQ